MALPKFHTHALTFIITQSPGFSVLLSQIPYLTIKEIEHTGVGCFYSYECIGYPASLPELKEPDTVLGHGCQLTFDNQSNEAILLLWIENKKIATLEIMSHNGHFPNVDPEDYQFETVPVNEIDLSTIPQNWDSSDQPVKLKDNTRHPYALRLKIRERLPWFLIDLGFASKGKDCEAAGANHLWYNKDDHYAACYYCSVLKKK